MGSNTPRRSLLFALAAAALAACVSERDLPSSEGVHPDRFEDPEGPVFHGQILRDGGYPLKDCRACHGDDYAGGAVGVSCLSAGCHTEGVESCGTCHDGKSPPLPTTGGHAKHLDLGSVCEACHAVPKDARGPFHPNGKVEVTLTGFAAHDGHMPSWDATSRTCADAYCHGPKSPVWEEAASPLACDACHAAPPPSHTFPVAAAPNGCVLCHPSFESDSHLNGALDRMDPGCGGCHGTAKSPAPPPALNGATEASDPVVGAHVRHLDGSLPDRIAPALPCEACHVVPTAMLDPGHMDLAGPADVEMAAGSYDPGTGSCVVGCHFDKDPGPVWNDTSGAARACDGCHAFPPDKMRNGLFHPAVSPALATCVTCHVYSISTHVDGHVDIVP